MMHIRMKPWQRLKQRCERCDAVATRVAYPTGDPIIDRGETTDIYLGGQLEGSHEHLGCEEHAQQITHELFEDTGSAASQPLRSTWWFWFAFESRLGQPFGRIARDLDEWRWDRGVRGKVFGYKLSRFALGDDDEAH